MAKFEKKPVFAKDDYDVTEHRLNPVARLLFLGVYNDEHALSVFRGLRYLVQAICEYAVDDDYWKEFLSYGGEQVSPSGDMSMYVANIGDVHDDDNDDCIYDYEIQFPQPQNLNINMMPFIMALKFEDTKLPQKLKKYYGWFIFPCILGDKSQHNQVGYLSIHESFVRKGKTQRRPGLHVESPGSQPVLGGKCIVAQTTAYWGGGVMNVKRQDGIYMASNVSGSCVAYDCKVDIVDERDVVGHLGSVEHLRKTIQDTANRTEMERGSIYWLTDRTPHESLPMQEDGMRQWLRLVTKNVSVWYEQHSTKNPNGVVPDPSKTRVIKESKF